MIKYIFSIVSAVVIVMLITLVFILPTNKDSDNQQAPSAATSGNTLLLKNIRVFDGSKFIENTNVLLKEGLIAQISSSIDMQKLGDIDLIEGQNLTVLPGIIDAHTHSYGNALEDALRLGVTTHLDMFTSELGLLDSIQQRQNLQQTDKADLFSSGTLATVDGGHGTQYGFAIDTIKNIDEVAAWVTRRQQAGADYIKLVYMPNQQEVPSLDKQTAKEVIKQGHLLGLKVLAHISTYQAAKDLIEADIDGLVHIFADQVVSEEVLNLAAEKDIFIIPTLGVIASADQQNFNSQLITDERISGVLSAQQKQSLGASFEHSASGFDFAIAKQNVELFKQAGVTILSGSDSPNPGTAYGVSAYHEIILLSESGLSNSEALAAATQDTATQFGLEDRGTIEVGKRADLVVIEGDPNLDIDTIFNLKYVLKNGFRIQQKLAQSNHGIAIKSALLGDFENQGALQANEGFSWGHTHDGYANGNSKATITQIGNIGVAGSGGLKVIANVKSGFPYPWAGAAVGDFSPPVIGVDISAYSHIAFDVKGTQGDYRVMSFTATATSIPPSQSFKVSQQWQRIRLPLSAFKGLDHSQLSGFAFVAGPALGKFEFVLDNVGLE
ncbi:amidohydrolase family protein [Aliiglaciecola sp. SL4]|uniref:amidohydrolase family protein n=1 Tax=Aliiglaciecola sp. SL4 TaxID=3239806 RepID=UPI00355B09AD